MKLVPIAEWAKLHGVTRYAANELVRHGRLPEASKIDIEVLRWVKIPKTIKQWMIPDTTPVPERKRSKKK